MQLPVTFREVELLFMLLDHSADDARLESAIERGVDWRYFTWLVQHERAVPVAARRLGRLTSGVVPEPVMTALQRLAVVGSFRMSRLEARLDETLAVLRAAGIEVILLKGAALATTVYPTFGARPMKDLDLLVRAERGEEAWELVRRVRWRWEEREDLARFHSEHHHYPTLLDEDGTELRLELHTALFTSDHPFVLPLESLWESAEPVPALGKGVYVLEPHAQALHLCIHFAWSHHMLSACWRSCSDLSALLGTGRVNWDELVELSRASRSVTSLYWTLRLARRLAGLEVPEGVLERLKPAGPEIILRFLERHYLTLVTPSIAECPSNRLQWALWEWGMRPRASGHGSSRPWSRSALFSKQAAVATASTATIAGRPKAAAGVPDVAVSDAAIAASGTAVSSTTTVAAATGIGAGGKFRRHLGLFREWWLYLAMVSGIGAWSSPRTAASRAAMASKRGRSASVSSERTLPAR